MALFLFRQDFCRCMKFGSRFREALEDLSGRNPLLLRGVEKAVCEYKKHKRSKEDKVFENENGESEDID
jgi:hypothetical protein